MLARAAPQRHLANKHALPVSGTDSYALLFLFQAADLRLVNGGCVSITHRTDFESVVSFQVALTKELFHDAVCPLTIQVQRLGRVAQVSTVHQRL